MEFIQGIYFHSNSGFKYLISSGNQPFDFATDRYMGDLSRIQSFSVSAGQKFYLVYPVKTSTGNKQVFGSGEIVRSLQPDRPVVVPFLHYFACNLSDSVNYTMNFETFFKEHNVNYSEMYTKSQTEQNLTPPTAPVDEQSVFNYFPNYSDLQESIGLRGSKTKKYVSTIEEGLIILNNLMASPNVIRWSFSAILTPLDADYPENIVIVYGKPSKPQLTQKPPTLVQQLYSASSPQILLNQFINFIATEKGLDPKTAKKEWLDTQTLDELDEILKKFLKEYPKIQQMSEGIINSNRGLTIFLDTINAKINPTPQDLVELDMRMNQHELEVKKIWYDSLLAQKSDIPEDKLASSLANYSSDALQKLLDGTGLNFLKITNGSLRGAMKTQIEGSNSLAASYWSNEFAKISATIMPAGNVRGPQMPSGLTAEQCVTKSGPDQFISVGARKVSENINMVSFDKAVQYIKAFSTRVSNVVTNSTLSEKIRSDLAVRGVSYLPDILTKLQGPIDRFDPERQDDAINDYYTTEELLLITVNSYLTALMEYDKRHGELLNENNYNKAIISLKSLIDAGNTKQQKALDMRKKKLQETFDNRKAIVDEQYKKLANSFKKAAWTKVNFLSR